MTKMDSAVDHRNPGTKLQAFDHEPLIQPAIRDFRQCETMDESRIEVLFLWSGLDLTDVIAAHHIG